MWSKCNILFITASAQYCEKFVLNLNSAIGKFFRSVHLDGSNHVDYFIVWMI